MEAPLETPSRHGIPAWLFYLVGAILLAAGLALPWALLARRTSTTLPPPIADGGAKAEPLRPRMIVIPLGDFVAKRWDLEKDYEVRFRLTVPFAISQTEITQHQYRGVMGENPSQDKACGGDCPVERVLWIDAVKFCNKLSEVEALKPCYEINGDEVRWADQKGCHGYRLPTEGEWEVAARADQGDVEYAGTSDRKDVCTFANVADASGKKKNPKWTAFECDDGYAGLSPVAHYRPNPFHLYDMTGNVWEWVWDRWEDKHAPRRDDPSGPDTGQGRVYRGGSWYSSPGGARVASRGRFGPSNRVAILGFRVARSLPSSLLPSHPLPPTPTPTPKPSAAPPP